MNSQLRTKLFVAAILSIGTRAAHAQSLLFDNLSNYENGVSGAKNTWTPTKGAGDPFTLLLGATTITGFDLYALNDATSSYSAYRINIYVWGSVNTSGTVNASTPAYSNLLGNYTFTYNSSFGGLADKYFQSATPGVTPGITLSTPLAIPGNTVGFEVNYQGSTDGMTFSSSTLLTSYVTYGTAPTVGSQVFNGYYNSGRTEPDGNFTSAPVTFGYSNLGLAMRVYGSVSAAEPASLIALAALPGIALRYSRRRGRERR